MKEKSKLLSEGLDRDTYMQSVLRDLYMIAVLVVLDGEHNWTFVSTPLDEMSLLQDETRGCVEQSYEAALRAGVAITLAKLENAIKAAKKEYFEPTPSE